MGDDESRDVTAQFEAVRRRLKERPEDVDALCELVRLHARTGHVPDWLDPERYAPILNSRFHAGKLVKGALALIRAVEARTKAGRARPVLTDARVVSLHPAGWFRSGWTVGIPEEGVTGYLASMQDIPPDLCIPQGESQWKVTVPTAKRSPDDPADRRTMHRRVPARFHGKVQAESPELKWHADQGIYSLVYEIEQVMSELFLGIRFEPVSRTLTITETYYRS